MVAEFNPSLESLTLVISALTKPQDFSKGQQIHCHALKSGKFDIILQSSLVDFYAKCADLSSCFSLFEDSKTENRDIPWVAMMRAFVQNGKFTQVIDLHHNMLSLGFEPSVDALSCLITACSNLGALLFGKAVHSYLIRHLLSADFKTETFGTSLLSMYAKCGILPLAWRCFKNMACRDTIAWSAMIEAFAIHGIGLKALELFNQMIEEGTKPNSTTFLSLLSCCSHSGLLSEGCQLFCLMTQKFSIKPQLSHYTCMVDLLARAGKLIEALNLIHSMEMRPDGRIWGALLASCRVHQNLNIGSYAAQRLFKLEPENMGYHIVSSAIHANPSVEAEQIWKFMNEMEFKGRPGWSFFEEKGGFSIFVAGDYSHLQMQEIYRVLSCLGKNMEENYYL
ncbi:hypothetical protein HPP92_018007 [Vanilla planifolia]|uniref:Pentatricopeptide repeat-containing protein n=1 Tax=Vanilla planifolia TaxID=51239 RepID=A0A835QAB7_VANPL|nr:hypothetical protein HPP92_018007 [Vanilla planifolia]